MSFSTPDTPLEQDESEKNIVAPLPLEPVIETVRDALHVLGFVDVPLKRKFIQRKCEEMLKHRKAVRREAERQTPEEREADIRIFTNIQLARDLLIQACPQKGNTKQRHAPVLYKHILPNKKH